MVRSLIVGTFFVFMSIGCHVVLGIRDVAPDDSDADAGQPVDACAAICADACQGSACPDAAPENLTWWDDAFDRRRRLCMRGDSLTEPLRDVPISIALTDQRIDYQATQDLGEDVRFIAADQATELDHEIEAWTESGTSQVWLRVPTLEPGMDACTVLWMYYGNQDAQPRQNSTDVWTAGFESVHHLHGTFVDSTGRGHDGDSLNLPNAEPCQVGDCYRFDGDDDYIELDGESGFDFTTSLSVTAWINVDQWDRPWQTIVAKGDDSWRLHRNNRDNETNFAVTEAINTFSDIDGLGSVADQMWHHVAAVYDGQELLLYLDGAFDGRRTFTGTLNNSDFPVHIGANSEVGGRHFEGRIDEVRISSAARSPEWIAVQYRSMMDADLVEYGSEETNADSNN